MRNYLHKLVALVLFVAGVQSANAYSVTDLESGGWTKVGSIENVDNYYYVFVDAKSSAYMMVDAHNRGRAYYRSISDPLLFGNSTWVLESKGDDSYALKNAVTNRYYNSGDAGWNNSLGTDNVNADYKFALADGKYDIQSVQTSQYLGPWNNDGSVAGYGEDIAANKSLESAPGFWVYAMERTQYNEKLATVYDQVTNENPMDLTSKIENPSVEINRDGWTLDFVGTNNQKIGEAWEFWNGTAANLSFNLRQTLPALPGGKYTASVEMANSLNGQAAGTSGGRAYLYVIVDNGAQQEFLSDPVEPKSEDATARDKYTVTFDVPANTVADKVTIGVKTVGTMDARWFTFDNFTLSYLGGPEESDLATEEQKQAYKDALAEAETHVLGFAAGKYAPYTNVEAAKTVALAKAIDVENAYAEAVVATTDALKAAVWTVNTEEMNAIYDGSFAADYSALSGNVKPTGWNRTSGSNTGYEVRYTEVPEGATTTKHGMMIKFTANYGKDAGYTMPLKANSVYELSFKYAGWGNTPTVNVVIKDEAGNAVTIEPASFKAESSKGDSDATVWQKYEGKFTTGEEDANYVLYFDKSEDQQDQVVFGDFKLYTAAPEDVPEENQDYTSAIKNAAVASLDDWTAEGEGISYGDGLVKLKNNFDFNQTITLPAGQYKMTVKAAYRYGGGEVNVAEKAEYDAIQAGVNTHLAKVYAQTSTYKYEGEVQNRWEGRTETDLYGNLEKVSVIEHEGVTYYVPNSSAAVMAWFEQGQYVNELIFNVQEEGEVKIGMNKTETAPNGEYTNISAWTLTRLGDAEADPKEEEPTPNPGLEIGDVTAQFLTNADFEQASPQTGNAINTPPGWTMTYEASGWLDGSTRLSSNPGNDGSQCYNVWAGTVTSVEMWQKVNLPAGKYVLSAGFYSDTEGERYVYATVGGQTVKSSSPEIGSWHTVSVSFVNTNEGEVTLGAMCRDAWFQIDNVHLEYLGEVNKDDYVGAYNTVLAQAQALANEKMSVVAAALLETTVTENGSLTADNSIEELEAATAAISEALATVKVSVNSYKVLAAGALPDNSLEGWTCTNTNTFHINTWSNEGNFDGTGMVTPFIENWVANGSLLGSGKISYTLPGVDPGYYKASSLIRVYSEAGNDISGASFFANDVKTDFATGNSFTYDNKKGIYDTYTAVVNVGEDGVLTFGVEIADTASFNWVSFKNVKIEYIGVIDQAAVEALKAKIPTTKYDAALAAEIEALVAAVDADVTFDNYLALSEKVSLAETSAKAYASNKLAIDAMYALMESTNVYTAEAFLAYKSIADGYKEQYEAGTLTAAVDNPATIHGWHADVDYDVMLLSAFGAPESDWGNLHINTWSTEGETDGSEFKVPFFEYWTGDDQSLGTTTKTATVTGLTPGQYYSVEAWVRVRAKNGVAAADATGITLSVGDGEPVDITEGAVVGTSQFSHAVCTAYGHADAEGKLTINFNVLDGNNVSWLSFKNLKYAEAVEPFSDFYTNPSGEEALDKLSKIELFFFDLVEDVVVNEEVQATLTTPTFDAQVWVNCYENEDNPENVFNYILFELEETYTEPGEYVLTIPAGLFTVDGVPNAATKVYFTVKAAAPAFEATIVGVTPAEGEVTELNTIIVQFSNDQVMPQSNIFLTDEAGTQYEFQLDTNHPDYTQAKYVAMNGAITTAGTYTLDCSQIDHATSLWPLETINPFEGTYSWTIKAVEDGIDHLNADADAVIYDIHGRRVEKMTKGIYIVNGKKVIKK